MFRRASLVEPRYLVLAVAMSALPAAAQAPPQATGYAGDASAAMLTPTPVNPQGYSMEFASETPRSNYLRGGFAFSSAYVDGITVNGSAPVSDITYSIWPTIALDQSRSRLSWDLAYSPGFTFYQKTSVLNQAQQTADLSFHYSLTPHVTFTVHDHFYKTPDILSLSAQSPVNGGAGGGNPPNTVVAATTDQIWNQTDVGMTYQFAANAMVGMNGSFSLLQFPDVAANSGLFNSQSVGGQAFYTYRLSGRHYVGATYGYQDLRATPGGSETIVQNVNLFYTLYVKPTLSFSLSGGPVHSATTVSGAGSVAEWSPNIGGSFGWQAARTSVAAGVQKSVTAGNGLAGAAQSSNGSMSLREQLTRRMTAGVSATYLQNKTLQGVISSTANGHIIDGKASVQLSLREHWGTEIGYARVHQTYSGIEAVAPDQNRFWVSFSYQFQRPIGR